MAKKTPTRIKTTSVAPARDRTEAEALLLRIGTLQRRVKSIEGEMNDELADVKKSFEDEATPLKAQIQGAFQALHLWAEAHREELCKGRVKTAKLSTGDISWRTTPPKCAIRSADTVIECLKRLGMNDLVRTQEAINKEAILLDPARVKGVKGITVTQREEFVAKPFESQIEAVETVTSKPKAA